MKEAILFFMLTVCSVTWAQNKYYVAPNGNDSNPGTIDRPWKTWGKGFNASLSRGDTVFFRGGVYMKDLSEGEDGWYYPNRSSNGTGYKIGSSGVAGNLIVFTNYPGEEPILDCNNVVPKSNLHYGIRMGQASYIKLKGLTIRNVWSVKGGIGGRSVECTGMTMGNSGNVIENCKVYNIHGIGYKIEGAREGRVINSDAWNCCDSLAVGVQLPGERGTGFSQGNMSALDGSTYFYGCRAWNCSDQGFSTYDVGFVEYKECWAFNNGDLEADGTGFKLGFTANVGGLSGNKRNVENCIAAYNKMAGFNQNANGRETIPMRLHNNVAYRNGYGGSGTGGFGYIFFKTSGTATQERNQILRNNIGYANEVKDFHLGTGAVVTHDHNSWDQSLSISDSDFMQVDASVPSGSSATKYSAILAAPRKSDGSLPDIDFLKPTTSSRVLDRGTDVGLIFYGEAPDLGYWQYDPDDSSSIFELVKSSPDLTIDLFAIEFNGEGSQITDILVKDERGRIVLSEGYSTREGLNKVVLDLSPLRSGNYDVELSNGSKILKTAVYKQQYF